MSRINQPIGQVKLTNVAVVRYTVKKQRFEIACYRNKVVNWRQGLESDVNEVLQTDKIHVFANVERGEFANSKSLRKCFGTSNQLDVAKTILDRGAMQVGELERQERQENIQRDIATWIADNCVHPDTGYPYTPQQIRSAMKQANYIVHMNRPMKRQYLDCVKLIQSTNALKMERAKMELCFIVPPSSSLSQPPSQSPSQSPSQPQGQPPSQGRLLQSIRNDLSERNVIPTSIRTGPPDDDHHGGHDGGHDGEEKEDDEQGGGGTSATAAAEITMLVDPSFYRGLQDLAKKYDDDGVRLEILQQVVKREGDSTLHMDVNHHHHQPTVEDNAADGIGTVDGKEPEHEDNNDDVDDEDDDDGHDDLAHLTRNRFRISQSDRGDDDDDEAEGTEEEEEEEGKIPLPPVAPSITKRSSASKRTKKEKRRAKREQEEAAAATEPATLSSSVSTTTTTTKTTMTMPSSAATGRSDDNHHHNHSNHKSCNTCGGSFDPSSYRAHFRSDWHRYNIKLKLKNQPAVSLQEFQLCDADAFFKDVE